jgi:hypothetical protein
MVSEFVQRKPNQQIGGITKTRFGAAKDKLK